MTLPFVVPAVWDAEGSGPTTGFDDKEVTWDLNKRDFNSNGALGTKDQRDCSTMILLQRRI